MSTKKINITEKVVNVVETAKTSVKKANIYALNTTEDVVLETITIATQWQKVTQKALKGSVKLMANQQDLIFDALDSFKANLLDGKKKISKIFA
ncbi:MAG: hypothetical protein V3V28_14105 [Polaribacter sp.]|uniref:hypothetical protein n=1 Tax=Polaribacter sp. TaxID=1920175 RepID=UPI002F35C7FF